MLSMRKKYCMKLIKAVHQYFNEIELWKTEEARMRKYFHLKLSLSKNMDSFVIDILDTRKQALSFEGPDVPLTLILSGEGKYHNPFYLEIDKDPLVKAIGMRLGSLKIWQKFVQNLNSKLI